MVSRIQLDSGHHLLVNPESYFLVLFRVFILFLRVVVLRVCLVFRILITPFFHLELNIIRYSQKYTFAFGEPYPFLISHTNIQVVYPQAYSQPLRYGYSFILSQ